VQCLPAALVPNAPGATHRRDVYVWDRVSDPNRRVTVADNGGNPNGESLHAEISYDGTYIAFQSQASNLVAGDTNGKTDVFRAGNPFLGVSTNARNVVTGDGNGQRDAFLREYWETPSAAFNKRVSLAYGTENGDTPVAAPAPPSPPARRPSSRWRGPAGRTSARPFLSADGRVVAFLAGFCNLVPNDNNFNTSLDDTFVRDYR